MTTNKYFQRKVYDIISNKQLLLLLIISFVLLLLILNYLEIYFLTTVDTKSGCFNSLDNDRHCIHCICEPVDAVYTWVNGSDPDFQNQLKLYSSKEDAVKADRELDISRFDDKYELKYSLRSLEKNLPWIRNVYIVTNGQIPYWLNLDNRHVHIITHKSLFKLEDAMSVERVLPTFSSPAIETFFHRIPGLSERFLYMNDDILVGARVNPWDWCSGHRHKVVTSWPVPDCLPGCSWAYIGDNSCDPKCNNKECQFDGGDCDKSEASIHSQDANNPEMYHDPDHYEGDHERAHDEQFPGLNVKTLSPQELVKKQMEDLSLLRDVIEFGRQSEKADLNQTVTLHRKLQSTDKFDYDRANLNDEIKMKRPKYALSFRNLSYEIIKQKFNFKFASGKNLSGRVKDYNRKYLLRNKRRLSKIDKEENLSHKTKLVKDDRKLDEYAKSLIYTNRIFNKAYDFKMRRVPSHMGFLVDKKILKRMHDKFKTEIEITQRNRFRSDNDFQFSFAYYHFMMSEVEEVSLDEIFTQFDTDKSGTWSDREIRTLLVRQTQLPLGWETVLELEMLASNCTRLYPLTIGGVSVGELERYVDSTMPVVTLALIKACKPFARRLTEWFGRRARYHTEQVPASQDGMASFKQLVSNASTVLHSLDQLRRDTRKFICINDNMDSQSTEQNELVRALLFDFYESFFPFPSQFELPADVRNRFSNTKEYNAWKTKRRRTETAIYLSVAFLACLTLYSLDMCHCFRRKH